MHNNTAHLQDYKNNEKSYQLRLVFVALVEGSRSRQSQHHFRTYPYVRVTGFVRRPPPRRSAIDHGGPPGRAPMPLHSAAGAVAGEGSAGSEAAAAGAAGSAGAAN